MMDIINRPFLSVKQLSFPTSEFAKKPSRGGGRSFCWKWTRRAVDTVVVGDQATLPQSRKWTSPSLSRVLFAEVNGLCWNGACCCPKA